MLVISYYIFLLVLFLPTFIANAIPVLVKNIPIIKKYDEPISKKYFWKNKTYRWFIFGTIFAILISILTFEYLDDFYNYYWDNSFINNIYYQYYSVINSINIAIFTWFLQWFWALLGDLIESYIKRKVWKHPWSAWPFWDWVDYIIWSLVLFSIIFIPPIFGIIFLILFSPLISFISNIISYFLWWKNVRY